jgi:hypothetical protein
MDYRRSKKYVTGKPRRKEGSGRRKKRRAETRKRGDMW